MKNFSPAYAAHVQGPVTTLALCWRIEKRNGDVILGTDHDRDIPITETNIGIALASPGLDLSGIYAAGSGVTGSDIRSSSDMSVDNMDVNGAIASIDTVIDITVADIESGLLDAARVTTFRVNWQNPDDFQEVMRHGFLGEIARTSEGAYKTEVRGLTQILQQTIGRTCGERCDVAEFGDSRCKLDVAAITVTGVVTAVTSRRSFTATLSLGSPTPANGYFNNGKLIFTTGENVGFVRQVRNDSVGDVLGDLDLWDLLPLDIEVGDEFTLAPGCDRRYETCRDVHNNLINFRGPGIFLPGLDQIIRSP